ncbi:MAG TPA: A24 family peptidase, partial [Micropepsaceae bacterium]|nr:A24 family peptidase [Micropepsaceae bacterium]
MNAIPISTIILLMGFSGLVAACVSDVRERLIYNEIVIFVLGTGIALRLISTPHLIWASLLIAACLLVALGQLARFDIIGGGDAKLIAAAMLLLPPQRDAWLLAHIAAAGGALSCIYLAARTGLRRGILTPARAQPNRSKEKTNSTIIHELARIRAGEPMPY